MSQPILAAAFQGALALLELDDLSVSEASVKSKRTAAAKVTHPDLFVNELDKQQANDRLSRINEACDLLLECLELGILPRFRYPKKLDDFNWEPADTVDARKPPGPGRSHGKRAAKKPPAWVRDEYKLFTDWCAAVEYLTVDRMDKEWKRRLEARRFDEEMQKRRESEATERLRVELEAEAEAAEEERRRTDAEALRQEKRVQKQAEAAERKRARRGFA